MDLAVRPDLVELRALREITATATARASARLVVLVAGAVPEARVAAVAVAQVSGSSALMRRMCLPG